MFQKTPLAWIFMGVIGCMWLASCNFSQPPAPADSKLPPSYLLKFVPQARDGAISGFLTLADSSTNQVAADGMLRLMVHSTMGFSVGEGEGGTGMRMKDVYYDNRFAIGKTNFHWETYGSMFSVNDLALKFVIPYENMKKIPPKGKIMTVEMEFSVTGTTNIVAASKRVVVY